MELTRFGRVFVIGILVGLVMLGLGAVVAWLLHISFAVAVQTQIPLGAYLVVSENL